MEKFEARQRDLVAGARWVIDGNYNSTLHVRLEAADTVIFMDLPTRSCLRGTLIHRRLWFTTVCWALQQSPLRSGRLSPPTPREFRVPDCRRSIEVPAALVFLE
jgi:hypothetical protein